jgi:Domain of unknown function (DUF4157)
LSYAPTIKDRQSLRTGKKTHSYNNRLASKSRSSINNNYSQRQPDTSRYQAPISSIQDISKSIRPVSSTNNNNNSLVQAKLRISQPGDIYEQEADRVADQIMMIAPSSTVLTSRPSSDNEISRTCNSCSKMKDEEDEEEFKKLGISGKPLSTTATSNFRTSNNNDEVTNEIINNTRSSSSGSSLDENTKEFMESRFGGSYDFSSVKIHTDEAAAKSSNSVNALAYTVGNDIVFAQGQYQPNTPQGRKLLAHELAHVTQQQKGVIQRQPAPAAGKINQPNNNNDKKSALKEGRADAALIRRSGKLSPEMREKINSKLSLFEGEAKAVYIREIKPALVQYDSSSEIEMPTEYVTKRAQEEHLKEIQAWKAQMIAELNAIKADVEKVRQKDIPELRQHAETLQKIAIATAELARQAEERAKKSAASARKWAHIAGGAKVFLHTVEAVVSCPLAETGIGAVGCVHALDSYNAAWKQMTTGEWTSTYTNQAIKGLAETVLPEEDAQVVADWSETALGGYTSAKIMVKGMPIRGRASEPEVSPPSQRPRIGEGANKEGSATVEINSSSQHIGAAQKGEAGTSTTKKPWFNPAEKKDACVGCVSATEKTRLTKSLWTEEDVARVFGETSELFTGKKVNLQAAKSYIETVTGRHLSEQAFDLGYGKNPPGHYIIFGGNSTRELTHVVRATIHKSGRLVIYDPAIAGRNITWFQFVAKYGKGTRAYRLE